MDRFDIVIIGGGPAGMSSLLWCYSLNLRGVLLEREPELGGQMLRMFHRINDYPGLIGPTGREMRDLFQDHLRELSLDWRAGCEIAEADLAQRKALVNGQWLSGQAMIIATGAGKRRLGIPGEDRFETRGVSYSATRDHSQYAGKKVCVIGGGDSAFENSLVLARVCPQVTLLHRSDRFRARQEWIDEARKNPKISIVTCGEARALEGGDRLERLIYTDLETGRDKAIEIEGVFIKIGIAPNTAIFAGQIDLDGEGYIKTDRRQRTSQDMVYAAGDVCRPVCLSVATAVGHGAIAVKDIALNINEPCK